MIFSTQGYIFLCTNPPGLTPYFHGFIHNEHPSLIVSIPSLLFSPRPIPLFKTEFLFRYSISIPCSLIDSSFVFCILIHPWLIKQLLYYISTCGIFLQTTDLINSRPITFRILILPSPTYYTPNLHSNFFVFPITSHSSSASRTHHLSWDCWCVLGSVLIGSPSTESVCFSQTGPAIMI